MIAVSRRLALSAAALLLASLPVAVFACTPEAAYTLTLKNNTGQPVVVYVNETKVGELGPDAKLQTRRFQLLYGLYIIEAMDRDGRKVYSREFTWQDLNDADWMVAIPAPQRS